MKICTLLVLLLLTQQVQARAMYKVKCSTPSPREDRTVLSQYIHLDMIAEDHVVSMVNESELKDLKDKTNLLIEVLAAFDTEKSFFYQNTFNAMLTMQESPEQNLEYFQDYFVSSKTELIIDLNKVLQEKNPLEKRNLALSIEKAPEFATSWKFSPENNALIVYGGEKSKGKADYIQLRSSSLFPPSVLITVKVSYK